MISMFPTFLGLLKDESHFSGLFLFKKNPFGLFNAKGNEKPSKKYFYSIFRYTFCCTK